MSAFRPTGISEKKIKFDSNNIRHVTGSVFVINLASGKHFQWNTGTSNLGDLSKLPSVGYNIKSRII